METRGVMAKDVKTCKPTDALSVPARLMWEKDLGAIPVVDDQGRALSMITIGMFAWRPTFAGERLENITVADAMSRRLFWVSPSTSIKSAMEVMAEHQVRRVPVVDDDRRLVGVLSLNDIARVSFRQKTLKDGVPEPRLVAETLATIAEPRSATTPADGMVETRNDCKLKPVSGLPTSASKPAPFHH